MVFASRLVSRSASSSVSIVGAKGLVQAGRKVAPSTTELIEIVVKDALKQAQLELSDLDGFVSVPSLQNGFMEAHAQATHLGLFDNNRLQCRTVDTGGAGPITALLQGARMIQHEGLDCVAVVAADVVGSLDSRVFLNAAERTFRQFLQDDDSSNPVIPQGYNRVTEHQLQHFGVTRDQLRMAVCLESFHANLHPDSLLSQKVTQNYTTLEQVRASPAVTPHISLLECAFRADGAGCLLLVSSDFSRSKHLNDQAPIVISGGEASGPLYPSLPIQESHVSSCRTAMDVAYTSAGLSPTDIDWFGLYDCFPICLLRAVEASGLAPHGGTYLQSHYERMIDALQDDDCEQLLQDPTFFPVNTHGGLLCYGAPWEVPAIYNVIEAVDQLQGRAKGRQIDNCQTCLVYGNGGVFSASAVAILGNPR